LYKWLPAISHHFPGITPLTVYDLTLHWWRIYLATMKQLDTESKKQHK